MADAPLKRCIARLPFFYGWVIAGIAFVTMVVGVAAIGAFYRRLSARIGKSKAVTATARKIAVLFYNALRHVTCSPEFPPADS